MNFDGVFFNTNDFEITEKSLGKGNFGKVYIVKNLIDGNEYAAKIINVEDYFNGREQMLFLRESLILRNLHHPSIVQFIGVNFQSFIDPRQMSPTIITEFLPNGSLKQILDKEKKSIADPGWNPTKKYISLLGISSAMRYLHKHGILHRDLKPENILIDENYYPRVCDFGLSKCFPESLSKSMELTMTRNVGTPMYMAPEILNDEGNDDEKGEIHFGMSVDVYAFGILAYEIITGKEPYSELGKIRSFTLATKIVSGYRPPMTPDVPEKMNKLISRCWSSNVSERPTFDEIYSELVNDFSYSTEDVDEDEVNDYIITLSEKEDELNSIHKVPSKSDTKENQVFINQLKSDNDDLTNQISALKEELNDNKMLIKDTDVILQMILNHDDNQPITKIGELLLFLTKENLHSKDPINNGHDYLFIPDETDNLQEILNKKNINNIGFKSNIIEVLYSNSALQSAKLLSLLKNFQSSTFQIQSLSANLNAILPVLSDLKRKSLSKSNKIFIEIIFNEVVIEKILKNQDSIDLIKFSPSVSSIGNNIFKGYTSLTSITIPPSIKHIGSFSFENCSKLSQITIDPYQTKIEPNAFYNCTLLKQLIIGSSVKSIKQFNFNDIGKFSYISIPASVKEIKEKGFSGCASLVEIVVPSSVKTIEKHVFSKCPMLNKVTLSTSISKLDDYTFDKCSSLSKIEIPLSVKSIGNYCFNECKSLNSVEISSSVTKIKDHAFDRCSSLLKIVIPSSVTSIGKYSFRKCTSLKYVFIPTSVTSIKNDSFQECSSLILISFPNSASIDIKPSVKKIINAKDEDALFEFGRVLIKGVGIPADKNEGYKFIQMAIEKGSVKAKKFIENPSQFDDNDEDQLFEKISRENALFLAQVYDHADLHKDMVKMMKYVIQKNPNLNSEEQNLLSVAYKNLVNPLRNNILMIDQVIEYEEGRGIKDRVEALNKYKDDLFAQLKSYCLDLINIINTKILPASINAESRVFCGKTKADYYKRIYEVKHEKEYLIRSKQLFERTIQMAQNEILPFKPSYLGLFLNYTVFLYECLGQKEEAIELAKRTYNDSSTAIDDNSDYSFSEATLILQMMRDNVDLWESEKT